MKGFDELTLIYVSAVQNFRLKIAGIFSWELISRRPIVSLPAKYVVVIMAGVACAGMFLARSFSHLYEKAGRKKLLGFQTLLRTYCHSNNDDLNMKIIQKNSKLRFVLASPNAFPPFKGSTLAAGYDLRSAYDCVVPARGKYICKTDLIIAIPEGCYGRVAPRSGLAVKNFIDVGAGVIDCDYRGKLGVVLFNFSDEDYKIQKGDRIAQLICEKIAYPDLEQVDSLDETSRGEGGFGSSGKN